MGIASMAVSSPDLKAFLIATPFFGGLSDASLDLLVSMLVEIVVYRTLRLRRVSAINIMIATLGVSIVLQNVARSLNYANAMAGRFVGMEIDAPPIDFAALAGSMGVFHARADERAAILEATARAVARGGPTLIEVAIK